jgi:Helix-turn-helix domain
MQNQLPETPGQKADARPMSATVINLRPRAAKPKRYFAAIPPRAKADARLTALMWRVLVAIACHDRMGKGQGCWASSTTLAAEVGTRPDEVRRAIKRLIEYGYIRSEPRPGRTQRTLRIVHDHEQAATCGSGSHTSGPRPVAGDAPPVAPGATQKDSPIGEREKIARSASAHPSDSPAPAALLLLKKNSAEAASVKNDTTDDVVVARLKRDHPSRVRPDGEFLRLAEAWVKKRAEQPTGLQPDQGDECQRIRDRCEHIMLASENGEPAHGWAMRVGEDAHWLLDQAGATEPQPPTVRPVAPAEIADRMLALVATYWPSGHFTLTAATKQALISRSLCAATLDHLCEQGRLEHVGKLAYRLGARP